MQARHAKCSAPSLWCSKLAALPHLQVLTVAYNKQRQAKITQELSEIVGGAAASGA
jgi:hypothetical protein